MSSYLPELLPNQREGDSPFGPSYAPQLEEPRNKPPQKQQQHIFLRSISFVFGWTWSWLVGALFCMNYFASILVAGWMYRWMQGRVLRNWWKKSRFAREGTFQQYCDSLGLDGPNPRPRWFLRERMRAVLAKPAPNGQPAGLIRMTLRRQSLAWYSLWLNFKIGVTALFCTYLLTGWGCLLMLFGWEFGWLNSFHKGYELTGIGPGVSLAGVVLFIAALYYGLMAQVHQAVIGERMAFFDFAFVWKLIQIKPTAYLFLVILLFLVSLPLEVLKIAVFAPIFPGNNPSLTDAEVLQFFQQYVFFSCLFFFACLLLVRRVACNIYSNAILKGLQQGRVNRKELHPKLDTWLEQLEITPIPAMQPHQIIQNAKKGLGWTYRKVIYASIFLVLFSFVAKRYVGEFLVYHPVTGFMNHELVQIPSFDLITGTPVSKAQQ